MRYLIINPQGQTSLGECENGKELESLQNAVGGYLEQIYLRYFPSDLECFVKEEPSREELNLHNTLGIVLNGKVVFCGKDMTDITDEQVKFVNDYILGKHHRNGVCATLTIKRQWFDLIACGEKTVEVRSATTRNQKLLRRVFSLCDDGNRPTIELRNGLFRKSPFLVVEVVGYTCAKVTADLNVPIDFLGKNAFLLKLGQVLFVSNGSR